MNTLLRIVVVAAVATMADYAWYTFGVRHTVAAGVIHGAVVLTAVGGVLGAASGRLWRGLPVGTLAGIAGAASYYVLVAVMDRRTYGTAIPAAWILTWFYLAAFDGRWVRAPYRRSWSEVAGRGVTAALAGGLAFYLVMNVLWGRPPAGGRNYGVQFLAWAFAWAPGLLALTVGASGDQAPGLASPKRSTGQREGGASLDVGVSADRDTEKAAATSGSMSGPELLARLDRGDTLHILDVRSEWEFADGHVPGAVNVPFTQVLGRMPEVPGTAADELIVYCGHGPRAYMAATALRRSGRSRIVYMSGHWAGWQAAGLREER